MIPDAFISPGNKALWSQKWSQKRKQSPDEDPTLPNDLSAMLLFFFAVTAMSLDPSSPKDLEAKQKSIRQEVRWSIAIGLPDEFPGASQSHPLKAKRICKGLLLQFKCISLACSYIFLRPDLYSYMRITQGESSMALVQLPLQICIAFYICVVYATACRKSAYIYCASLPLCHATMYIRRQWSNASNIYVY